jgi:hypothetical protein
MMTGEEEEELPPVFNLKSPVLRLSQLRETFRNMDNQRTSTLTLAHKAQELYPEYCTQKATNTSTMNRKGTGKNDKDDDDDDDDGDAASIIESVGDNPLKLSQVFNGSDMTLNTFVENIKGTSKMKIQDILFGR